MRPKFRQLQRSLGPAYTKSQALVFGNSTRERGTESRLIVPRLRAYASG